MKIAFFVHSLNPSDGGVASASVEMALALHSLGHEVELVSFDDPRAIFLSALPEGLGVHAIGPGRGAWGYIKDLPRRLAGVQADYFILNGLWLYSTSAVARYAQAHQIPYLLFPHGMLDPYFKRFFFKHLKKSLYWLWREAGTISHANCVCYTTQSEKALAQKTFFPYRPRREAVIGLGLESFSGSLEVAQTAFREHFPALGPAAPFLLYMSRFHPKKGADLLLKVLWEFPDLTLVMAGPLVGPQEHYAAKLKAMAPPGRVVWTGLLTGGLKWGALSACSGLILPSHQENFGMVVAEALSVGTPVLISDKVAIAPEVQKANAGWVQPDTLAGVRALLTEFCSTHSQMLDNMSHAAKRCYAQNFAPTAVAQKLQDLLQ